MGEETRPRDYRLVPLAGAAWLGVVSALHGWGIAGVLGGELALACGWGWVWFRTDWGKRLRWLGLATGVALALGGVAGHLAARDYRADPTVQLSDGAQLRALVRLDSGVVLRATPWGQPEAVATGAITAVAKGDRWLRSGAQVRLSGSPDVLLDVGPGTTVRVSGRLERGFWEQPPRVGQVRVRTSTVAAEPSAWLRWVGLVRNRMLDLCAGLPAPAGALVLGMSVGDRQLLDQDLSEAMRVASLTHLTAISGTHIAVAMAVISLATPGWKWGRPLFLLAFLAVLIGVVGPTASVVRAAAMAALVIVGWWGYRSSQSQVALAAVVLGIVLLRPWMALQYGFTLSVLATAGIIFSGTRWADRLGRWSVSRWGKVVGERPLKLGSSAVAVSAAASLWVLPVLVTLNPWISLWAIPANVLATPAVAPTTILGLLAAATATWAPTLADWCAKLAALPAGWISRVAQLFASLPAAKLPWPAGSAGPILAAILVGLVLGIIEFNWDRTGRHRHGR